MTLERVCIDFRYLPELPEAGRELLICSSKVGKAVVGRYGVDGFVFMNAYLNGHVDRGSVYAWAYMPERIKQIIKSVHEKQENNHSTDHPEGGEV